MWHLQKPAHNLHASVSITLCLRIRPGLKLRDTADRITLIWPPLITWRKWTDSIKQCAGLTVKLGLVCMMIWTAGDGHWIILHYREVLKAGMFSNQLTRMDRVCVCTCHIIEERGVKPFATINFHSFAMMVRIFSDFLVFRMMYLQYQDISLKHVYSSQEEWMLLQVMCMFINTTTGLKLRVTAENITQTSSVSGMRLKTSNFRHFFDIILCFGLDCTEPDLGQIRATLHSVTGGQDSQIMLETVNTALQCHLVTLGTGQMKTVILHYLSFATVVSISFRPQQSLTTNIQYTSQLTVILCVPLLRKLWDWLF